MKRLSYGLLCSAGLAVASASPAENPAGEPEAETLAVAAEGFDVLVPVPDGWIRIDDLKMILWKYSRFDDFNWDGQSDFPKTNLKPGRGSK